MQDFGNGIGRKGFIEPRLSHPVVPSGPKEMQLSCREKEMPEHVPVPGWAMPGECRGCVSDLVAMMGTQLHTPLAAHPAPAASRKDDPSTSQLSAAVMMLFL